MAHMLARLVYLMLRYGEQYVDKVMKYYDISRARNPQHSEKSQGPRPRGYSLHRRIREVSEEPPVCRQSVRNRPDARPTCTRRHFRGIALYVPTTETNSLVHWTQVRLSRGSHSGHYRL